VVDRTPLKFSVSGSSVIDDYDAINMGFLIDNETLTYTVVNNEKSDINLTSFPGINGDFIIPSFETFILKKGESFNLDIGFVASANTFNKRVSSEVKFFDKDGRAYTFYLWATSRNQPISLYDIDLDPIEECDLGAWGDLRRTRVYLKNEGLSELNILSIDRPGGIILDSRESFSLGINQIEEISFYYDPGVGSVSGESIIFNTDYFKDNTYELPVSAGGSLDLIVKDSAGNLQPNNIDFGTYVSGDQIVLDFTITNNQSIAIDLDIELASDMFLTDLFNLNLGVDETKSFKISFLPSGDFGVKGVDFIIRNVLDNRKLIYNLTGNYSEI